MSDLTPTPGRQRIGRWMLGVAVVAILVLLTLNLLPRGTSDTPPPPTTAPPATALATATPPTSTTPRPSIILESPTENQEFVGVNGVTVSGIVNDLGSDDLWIFDVAEGPSGGRGYFRVNEIPLVLVNGRFSAEDKPIGAGASDVGQLFAVAIVRASADCSAKLQGAKPDANGNIFFGVLPAGCRDVGQRTIRKIAP